MAIQNYGDLKSSVATWLNRADLTSYIPDFIRLGEQRIFYGGESPYQTEPVRVPAMQTRETGTITSSAIAYPTRFLEVIGLSANSGGTVWTLDYATPILYASKSQSAGLPSVYALINNTIATAPTSSAGYTLDYYQAFANLSSDTDTNWLLTNLPGIYLYAALIETAPFLGDAPMFTSWMNMYASMVAAANRTTRKPAGGTMATRVVM
jgi:hypothetical protein